jgi:hypothetical protein
MNDYRPEIRSLLTTLKKHGFVPHIVNNGEEIVRRDNVSLSEFVEEIVAVDEAHLYVKNKDNKKFFIYIVLGNEPGEIAADYSAHDPLDNAISEHYNRWESKKQPTK